MPSPVISRKHGFLSIGEKPADLISFYGGSGVPQPAITAPLRSVLEQLNLVPTGGGGSIGVTATTDGLTTGIVPDYADFVTVTSSASTKKVTLPTPTPGKVVRIYVGANGFKLQSTVPASISINGGSGAGVVSAVGANLVLTMICENATTWVGTSVSSAGVTAAVAVAA